MKYKSITLYASEGVKLDADIRDTLNEYEDSWILVSLTHGVFAESVPPGGMYQPLSNVATIVFRSEK